MVHPFGIKRFFPQGQSSQAWSLSITPIWKLSTVWRYLHCAKYLHDVVICEAQGKLHNFFIKLFSVGVTAFTTGKSRVVAPNVMSSQISDWRYASWILIIVN